MSLTAELADKTKVLKTECITTTYYHFDKSVPDSEICNIVKSVGNNDIKGVRMSSGGFKIFGTTERSQLELAKYLTTNGMV